MDETYYLLLLGLGAMVFIIVWIVPAIEKLPLSLPIVCLVLGFAVFSLAPLPPVDIPNLHVAERIVEAVVVIALMGAGLSIDRPFRWRTWQTTWRLLGIAMPLTIALMTVLFVYVGQFTLPVALLLAAMLSPTDPVLASQVGVGPPGKGEEGEIRFGLTSEAGFNDGLSFPVVGLAMALASTSFAEIAGHWLLVDVLRNVIGGAAVGILLGWLFGWLTFKLPAGRLALTGEGLAVLGLALVCYGAAQALGLNGFVAVFVMALRFRASSPHDRFHAALADFAGKIEHLLTMLIVTMLGAALALGMLGPVRGVHILLAAALLFVVRPLTAWLSLIGSPHPPVSRALTSWFGIRGISTLYYLLYALHYADFAPRDQIVPVIGWTVAGSILIHGITATPLMARADRIRKDYLAERTNKRRNAPGSTT